MDTSINTVIDIQANKRVHSQGTVYKKTIGNYFVHVDGRVVTCALSTRLRKQLVYPTADPHSLSHIVVDVKGLDLIDPVAVGDEVQIVDEQDGTGLIVEILPRKSKLVRRAARPMPDKHAPEQLMVANVDQVIPVLSAANPAPKWSLLDRYLVSAESMELASIIVITKADLALEDDELRRGVSLYHEIGYRLILTSAVTGEGLDELGAVLKGKLSVFIGKSGVGKSTLLNTLQPGLGIRVNEVSQVTGKGRHTTTHLEMFPLDTGGAVIDTPGMREFGLHGLENEDLAVFFPEMRPLIGRCKFGLDCSHVSEPGCAILKAIEAGKIDPGRYESFVKLREEE